MTAPLPARRDPAAPEDLREGLEALAAIEPAYDPVAGAARFEARLAGAAAPAAGGTSGASVLWLIATVMVVGLAAAGTWLAGGGSPSGSEPSASAVASKALESREGESTREPEGSTEAVVSREPESSAGKVNSRAPESLAGKVASREPAAATSSVEASPRSAEVGGGSSSLARVGGAGAGRDALEPGSASASEGPKPALGADAPRRTTGGARGTATRSAADPRRAAEASEATSSAPHPPRGRGLAADASAGSPTSSDSLEREMRLLNAARKQLAAGRPRDALASIEQARALPDPPRFDEEWQALEILALAGDGQVERARVLARPYLTRHRGGRFNASIERALDGR